MSEQEAENKTFIVYPFSNDHEEEVEKVIKEIKEARRHEAEKTPEEHEKSRIHQSTETNLEALQLHNEVLNDTQSKESCGPVLKKTLF